MAGSHRVDLVTGAAGLVGANLVRTLLAEGRRVRALIRHDDRALIGLNELETVRGDLLDPPSLEAAVAGVGRIFHCAAAVSTSQSTFDRALEQVNHLGTRNLLQACRGCNLERFIQFSSVTALRPRRPGQLVDNDSPPATEGSAYARSKALADLEVAHAIRHEGLDAIFIHPSGVLGPHDHKPSPVGRALGLVYRGLVPAVPRGGNHFVDARDLASMTLAAAARGDTGRHFIVSDRFYSIRELVSLAQRIAGRGFPTIALPRRLVSALLPLARPVFSQIGSELPFDRGAIEHLSMTAYLDTQQTWSGFGLMPRTMLDGIEAHFLWWRSTLSK